MCTLHALHSSKLLHVLRFPNLLLKRFAIYGLFNEQTHARSGLNFPAFFL